jgi:hypothetical protein
MTRSGHGPLRIKVSSYGKFEIRPEYRGSTGNSSENVENHFAAVCIGEKSMKVAALVALSVLIALPAEAAVHRQNNVLPSCNNDGRCTTLNVTPPTSSIAHLRSRHIRTSEGKPVDANGNPIMVTVQTAYGFNITVHPAYASKFLKFFALLKDRGYKVPANITGCWAPRGTHVPGSNHYIGAACDIQTGWNRGPGFVYHMSDVVKQAGLYDGCSFHDCGHVEAIRGTHNRPPNLYAAIEKFKAEQSTANYQP